MGKAVPKQKRPIRTPSPSDDDASTAVANSSGESGSEEGDGSFRLRDVSVLFPEGTLTVVTGPTGSGKTALLVSCLAFLLSFFFKSYKYRPARGPRGNDPSRWSDCDVKRFLAGR